MSDYEYGAPPLYMTLVGHALPEWAVCSQGREVEGGWRPLSDTVGGTVSGAVYGR